MQANLEAIRLNPLVKRKLKKIFYIRTNKLILSISFSTKGLIGSTNLASFTLLNIKINTADYKRLISHMIMIRQKIKPKQSEEQHWHNQEG